MYFFFFFLKEKIFILSFFFFLAEDGIRDLYVTGVQTCALPISATEFWFWFDEPGAPVTSMPESVTLKVDATGGITATLYSCAFWGNSPETMVAQLVAEEFDCCPYDVSI